MVLIWTGPCRAVSVLVPLAYGYLLAVDGLACLMWHMGMEHLDYACHPYQIFTKFVCFATVFAVASHDRGG